MELEGVLQVTVAQRYLFLHEEVGDAGCQVYGDRDEVYDVVEEPAEGGVVITPPVTSNVLEGITRRTMLELLREELQIEVVEREIDRIQSEGEKEATQLRSAADTEYAEILAEAKAQAFTIRGSADAEATKHFEVFGQNPELAEFKGEDAQIQIGEGNAIPGLEEALSDRLSFRRFVGLSLDDKTPDHSTISLFKILPDGHAVRTPVKLGRRSVQFVEIVAVAVPHRSHDERDAGDLGAHPLPLQQVVERVPGRDQQDGGEREPRGRGRDGADHDGSPPATGRTSPVLPSTRARWRCSSCHPKTTSHLLSNTK